ncbi:MAG: SPOR domain-containing protein [Flavobacteriaceae bacterium]|nr:MAG: SPOR domain-containing protein [Flavobacteriaceae bacterium]
MSIQFEPDESVNYLASSFGLIEFHYPELREIESEVVQEVPALINEQMAETPVIALPRKELEKVIERVKEEPVVRKITSGSRYRYLAVAALLPLLFYMGLVVWQSDVIKDGNIHKSELNPFKTLKKPVYKERSKVFEGLEIPVIEHIRLPEDGLKGELEVEDDVMLPVIEETNSGSTFEEAVSRSEKAEPAVLNEPETKLEMKEKVVITATTIIADELFARPEMVSLPYHVMNGCYGVISNAKKQTKRLRGRGYDAAILDKKGKLYRVSQGSFTSEEEAINLLKKAKREDDPSAWLLKK